MNVSMAIQELILDGSQGEGIYLLRDPSQCNVINRPHVIQGISIVNQETSCVDL